MNSGKFEILKKYGICVYRRHPNWDFRETIGDVDTVGELLGFKEVVGKGFCTRVYQVEPTPLWSPAYRVKRRLGPERVLLIGDLDRKVTKIGTSVGGLGQMFTTPEEIHALGAEVGYLARCWNTLGDMQ